MLCTPVKPYKTGVFPQRASAARPYSPLGRNSTERQKPKPKPSGAGRRQEEGAIILDLEALERQLAELPLYAYFVLKSRDLAFSGRVRWICRTQCPRYGKSWSCPPAVGELEACRDRCLAFDNVLLLGTAEEVPDIGDLAATLATRPAHEAVTRRAEGILEGLGQEVFTLSSDSCALCGACAYPGPCRHPGRMRPCIESHGILLTETLERCGLPFQYGDNVVSWYSLLFFRPKK